jgi:hypothetical protein
MGVPVRITINGRIGSVLQDALCDLEAVVVPRHDVVVLRSAEMSDLVRLVGLMEQHGLEIDRITGRGPSHASPGAT